MPSRAFPLPNSSFFTVFKSNLRYFMISKNLQRDIVALNKEHLQDLLHIVFIGEVLPLHTPPATMNSTNYFALSKETVQLLFLVARCASVAVHF